MTVSDGQGGTASATRTANGSFTLDLSGLADGTLTVVADVSDDAGNTLQIQGPAITLDTTGQSLSFADETRALSINLADGFYGYAATVMALGDSLTHGWLGYEDPVTVSTRELQEGYRNDLFEGLLSQNAWIDYVGARSDGPDRMMDSDHEGSPGKRLSQITNNLLRSKVQEFTPDITILMAGTNDLTDNEADFFEEDFDQLIGNIETAISQFYRFAPEGAELIIATIPPKLRYGTEFMSEIANEGYSIVDGQPVVGDAENGTYSPGIAATVTALQATHPTLHLYQAPFDIAFVGEDDVHLTDEGYAAFTAGLLTLLETEFGISGGTIAGTEIALGAGDDVEGGQAGDLIVGSAAANAIFGGGGNDALKGGAGDDVIDGGADADRIEGQAGADTVTGGLGDDTFVFLADFSDDVAPGMRDEITDFGLGADLIALDEQFSGLVTVTDDAGGVLLHIGDGAGGTVGEIAVQGAAAQDLKGADLGGGTFALTSDDTLVVFVADTNYLVS